MTYRRSGGFAGLDLVAECAGSDLPEGHAQVARDLLDAPADAAVGAGPSTVSPPPGSLPGADRFTYTVGISEGARHRTFTWSDAAVPTSAQPLLAALGALAVPQRSP